MDNRVTNFQSFLSKDPSVYNAINQWYGFIAKEIKKPSKPKLPNYHPTKVDIDMYSTALSDYEAAIKIYTEQKEFITKEANEMENLLINYIKDVSGFNSIPSQYQQKVWAKAWSDGHSGGYSEVCQCLVDLIDIFDV